MGQRACPNPDCGRSISSDAQKCKYCGTEIPTSSKEETEDTGGDDLYLPVVCPDCGATIKAGLQQCPHCGYKRPEGDAKPTTKSLAPEKANKPPAKAAKKSGPKKPPQVIVPKKAAPEPAKPQPAPKPEPKSKPAPKPEPAAKPKAAPKPEPAAEVNPTPPSRSEQDAIDRRPAKAESVPPPQGLDENYLPDRPGDLPDSEIHVFLRGLQWAAKPMDYPTLIKNMREHKIGPKDFVYDRHQQWRTVAEIFNLPEVD